MLLALLLARLVDGTCTATGGVVGAVWGVLTGRGAAREDRFRVVGVVVRARGAGPRATAIFARPG